MMTRERTLSDTMEFDHPVQVHDDGTVTDAPAGIYAPDLYDGELSGAGWDFFSHGYTGQYGYAGPIMHNSEFIGGRLERDILATPGVYCAVVAYWSPEPIDSYLDNVDGHWYVVRYDRTLPQIHAADCATCGTEDDRDTIAEGWAIVRYTGDAS